MNFFIYKAYKIWYIINVRDISIEGNFFKDTKDFRLFYIIMHPLICIM